MKNTNYVTLSKENEELLKQFIRGSILGDGHLEFSSKNSKNARLRFCHSEKQTDYIKFKKDFLYAFDLSTDANINCYTAVSNRYKKGFCKTLSFSSKTHPLFSSFKQMYYNNKKRVINKSDMANIDAFALAIWYMDDGYLWHRKNKSSRVVLCTDSFTENDVLFLIDLLLKKWNLKCYYYNYKNEIVVSVESSQSFIDIVKPYLLNCFEYKTKLVHIKQDELLENPTLERQKEDNQQPSLDSNIFEGSTTNSQVQTDNAEDSNANTSVLQ
jgi:hypothetical protein